MKFFEEYTTLFSSITQKTVVITPNQRLNRFVQKQYGLYRAICKDDIWGTVNSYSWKSWIEEHWNTIQLAGAAKEAERTLVSSAQERYLWEGVVVSSENMLSTASVAELSRRGWKDLRQSLSSLDDLVEGADAEETALFKQWVNKFEEASEQLNLIDEVSLHQAVIQNVSEMKSTLPGEIILVGFDELTALDRALLAALEIEGVEVTHSDIQIKAQCCRVELNDTAEEIHYMGLWAAELIKNEPDASIGLVVPNLADIRPIIERILIDIFEPQYKDPFLARHAPVINVSAAQPLAQTPIISIGLLSLKLNNLDVDVGDLYRILTSAFIGCQTESDDRVKLVRSVSEKHKNISLKKLLSIVDREFSSELKRLSEGLSAVFEVKQKVAHKKCTFTQWSEVFSEQLISLGWPGSRTLDTLEYQQLSHWPEILRELSSLDALGERVGLGVALNELNKLAYVPFHPKTTDSPIQVLGLLEAAGQQFDYLWVMGLDYRSWPEPCKPNPLIPVAFQREKNMPRASMEKELLVSERLTKRLMTSAPSVVFSTPLNDGDQPIRCSPLIASIPLMAKNEIKRHQMDLHAHFHKEAVVKELVYESHGPNLVRGQAVSGGSQIMKDQAACAFRAFAKHRLHAVNSSLSERGISPITRGNLLHIALGHIWAHLGSQKGLTEMDEEALNTLIESSITSAWSEIRDSFSLGAQMKQIESNRAKRLIRQWLALEAQRMPFRVKAHEQAHTFVINDMPISVRIDRIDEVEDTGELIVIDYKTGRVDIKLWASDRPDDPQVPLYCIALKDHKVIAAAFAEINAQVVAIKGISPWAELMPGLRVPDDLQKLGMPEYWVNILQYWENNLGALAESFIQGVAEVSPKSINGSCLFCDLKSLCRIGMGRQNS